MRCIPEAVMQRCVADSLNFSTKFGAGEEVLAAMIRRVERLDPSLHH